MSFQEQLLSTLIGTISGFVFGLALFYTTTHLEKRNKTKQLIANLKKECEYVLKHHLKQIVFIKDLIDSDKYKITKKLPFDLLFRANKPFMERCFEEGVIYELLSENDIFDLMSIESQIIYEDEEIQKNWYSLETSDQREVPNYHRNLLKTRMDYCNILRRLIERCEKGDAGKKVT